MLVKNAYLGLFLFFLVLSSVYIFPPGVPQPADFLMAILVVILATGFVIRPPIRSDLVFVGALFVGYVALVNLFWFTQNTRTQTFLLSAMYYAYDFSAMMVVVSLFAAFRERFAAICQIAVVIAIVVELFTLFALPTSAYRAVGTFNNPNQLGYWSLLITATLLVLKRDERLTLTDFAVFCGAGYLALSSLSKAAMVSFALLPLTAVLFQRVTRMPKVLFLLIAFLGTSAVLLDGSAIERLTSGGVAQRAADRLGSIGEQGDDSLGGRGYDRIWRYPEYVILGAGEGAVQRFTDFGQTAKEIHSTFGTLLFSYGIVGSLLFFALLVTVFRRAPLAHMVYSVPVWTYGFTHQGLRDTMLWVFLGMVFGMAHYVRAPSPGRPHAVPKASAAAPIARPTFRPSVTRFTGR